ncbi:MAG: spore germination protein [Clostridia bacterium]|nr:spore germination protein [Clostridia bacterium]
MQEQPHADLLRRSLSENLEENISVLKTILNVPLNEDPIFRSFEANGRKICAVYIEGMADARLISEFVLHAMADAHDPLDGLDAKKFGETMIEVAQCRRATEIKEIISKVLAGMACILLENSAEALILETRGYAHRSVDKPLAETVVDGSHEGFNEHLRTNITLLRRYCQSPDLVTQMMSVGTKVPTQVAMVYLNGVADEKCVAEVKKRLMCIKEKVVRGTGGIQQLIEDHPFALVPQMLQTERPDRAASCLCDGQVAILVENSPYALIAPVTFFHLVHSSDDSFLRWQYGTALRIIRLLGLLISLFLPAFYIAVTMYHTHLVPMSLLSSIAEARANVPFPVIIEVLFMEFSFYLLNEAGLRTPSQIGSAFGIVGALVLGQAAVSASIISPILIIIIALTGLGNYVVPNYGLGIGIVLYRLMMIAFSAALGLYGLMIGAFLLTLRLCSLKSFGVDYFAPIAPMRRHNPDILLRLPIWMQQKSMFYASPTSWMRDRGGKKGGKQK